MVITIMVITIMVITIMVMILNNIRTFLDGGARKQV